MKKLSAAILTIILASVLTLGALGITAGAEPYMAESEGYDVYEIQYILKKFGYFSADLTGYYGDVTAAAVKAFQSDRGFEATGVADEDTVAAIRAAGCTNATVTVRSQLNVREEPLQDSTPIDSLTRDSSVYIYSEKDGWYHIETENENLGFVLTKYLDAGEMTGISGKIIEDSVNVRKNPDVSSAVAFKVSKNTEVWVVGGSGDWFKINSDGNEGYVFKKYVSIGGEGGAATTLSSLFTAWKGSVTASSLRIRSGPSKGYDAVSTISKGTILSVLGESGDWYYVELSNGTKGYASKDYIQKGSGAKTCTITVKDGTLNVRKGPGKNYEIVTTVKNGEVVTLTDDSSSWYKIKTQSGKEGYVSSSYVKLGGSLSSNKTTSYPSGTFKNGSQGSDVVTIQKRLKTLGYFTGTATGYYGSATVASVKKFQSANGLSANGTCNASTLEKMFASSAVKAGSSSAGGNSAPAVDNSTPTNSGSSTGQQIADYAKQFLGRPYILGANGPNAFDCSGFTRYVYRHFGINLPRTAYEQGYKGPGTKVTSISELQIGDLVFFNTVSDADLSDHAGIYIGNGQVIHASSGSQRKVVISSFSTNYYRTHFSWGRHVV